MALCSGCAAAGDGPLNVWACVFESGDCPMNTPCAETTLCCIIPRYVNEKQSPRSKNCIWLHQISSKGSHCGYSTFYRILKKNQKTPKNWSSKETFLTDLSFSSPLSSPRPVLLIWGRFDWCCRHTSCRVVVISMHDCIWIWSEKAITAQFHTQRDIWHVSPSVEISLSKVLFPLSVSLRPFTFSLKPHPLIQLSNICLVSLTFVCPLHPSCSLCERVFDAVVSTINSIDQSHLKRLWWYRGKRRCGAQQWGRMPWTAIKV